MPTVLANARPAAAVSAGHGVLSSVSSLPPDRRGRLRNGARPGDFLAAPRCGARTRCGGTCRQPAMKNGRCRLHGGLSTGPRTPEGRARCAAARTIHGGYNAATRALQADARAAMRRMRALTLRLRPTAGHGVLSSESKVHHRAHRGHRDATPTSARAARNRSASSVPSVSSVVKSSLPNTATAGYGVLSSKPSLMQRALLGTTALGISVRHPFSAGHGVLPSIAGGVAR